MPVTEPISPRYVTYKLSVPSLFSMKPEYVRNVDKSSLVGPGIVVGMLCDAPVPGVNVEDTTETLTTVIDRWFQPVPLMLYQRGHG